MQPGGPSIVWFRGRDVRVTDHPALAAACEGAHELVPVFVLSAVYLAPGRAERAPHRVQYLLEALAELERRLLALGTRLCLLPGPAREALPRLCESVGARAVFAIRSSEPAARAQEAGVAASLRVPLRLFDAESLVPPGSLAAASGEPFRVFTPFARAFFARARVRGPLPAPRRLPPWPRALASRPRLPLPALAALGVACNPRLPEAGETAAFARLRAFLRGPATEYHALRDRLDLAATSRLSADLRFGAISVHSVWHAAERALGKSSPDAFARFANELLWREFALHSLAARPELLRAPFRPEFASFPWRDSNADFAAWAEGRTGYPLVDAAARQLLAEGFVHNRARMVAASFLTKQLLISYRRGEAHYLKWLVDGDPAANNLGWQWCAGTGCDAQPYFRIFNPEAQGRRFDPEGAYVKRHLPELARLDARYVHAPWRAPAKELARAGVELGRDYPRPIVEHAAARRRYLLLCGTHLRGRTC